MTLTAGTVVGPYRIIEQVGRGGMATVYKAHQAALARYVALKVLPEFLASEEGFKERFQQEAVSVAQLRHPNILAVFDYSEGQVDGDSTAYIVTEFVDGGTLADQLGKPLPLNYTLKVLEPIAAAIDYAHARGVLHRDVKPSNILLGRDGTPFLADFGLAKIMERSGPALTQGGMVVGTPEYMAPEQCAGDQVGPEADVYSLAVVAYQMLTGQLPFTAATPTAVIMAQIHNQLPPPRSINPDLSPAVEAVLLKGLAKARADRYRTTGEMVRELAAAAAQGAVTESKPLPAAPAPPTPAPELPPPPAAVASLVPPPESVRYSQPPAFAYPPAPRPAAAPRSGRPGWLIPLAIILPLLLVAGGVGVAIVASHSSSPGSGPAPTHSVDAGCTALQPGGAAETGTSSCGVALGSQLLDLDCAKTSSVPSALSVHSFDLSKGGNPGGGAALTFAGGHCVMTAPKNQIELDLIYASGPADAIIIVDFTPTTAASAGLGISMRCGSNDCIGLLLETQQGGGISERVKGSSKFNYTLTTGARLVVGQQNRMVFSVRQQTAQAWVNGAPLGSATTAVPHSGADTTLYLASADASQPVVFNLSRYMVFAPG